MTAHHLHLVTDEETNLEARIARRAAEIIADMTARGLDYSAIQNAPITVRCSFCKSLRGWSCQTTNGYNYAGGFHAPRKRAIAHLSDGEKLAAWATYKAEMEQKRAVPLPPLTPEQLATRAAIRAAAAKVEAEVRAEEREMRARCRAPYIHCKDCTCRTDTEE